MAAMTTETTDSVFVTQTYVVDHNGRTAEVEASVVANPSDPRYTGPVLVLVPPFRSAVVAWLPVRRLLDQAGIQTVCFDGASAYPGWLVTAAKLAHFWMACLDAMGVTGQVDLAVWSWSGFMERQFTMDYGHRVRRVVMMAPGMKGPMTTPLPTLAYLSLVPRDWFPVLNALLLYAGRALKEPYSLAEAKGPANWKAQWVQSMAAVTSRFTHRLHHPTLVLFAHDDPLVGAGVMFFWWLLWGSKATFCEIPDGGHAFPYLNPEEVVKLVVAHLRGEYIQPCPPRLTEAAYEYMRQLHRLAFAPWHVLEHLWRR